MLLTANIKVYMLYTCSQITSYVNTWTHLIIPCLLEKMSQLYVGSDQQICFEARLVLLLLLHRSQKNKRKIE